MQGDALTPHMLTLRDPRATPSAVNAAMMALVAATRPTWGKWGRHLDRDEARQEAAVAILGSVDSYDADRPAEQYVCRVVRWRLATIHNTERSAGRGSGNRGTSLDADRGDGATLAHALADTRARDVAEAADTTDVARRLRRALPLYLSWHEWAALGGIAAGRPYDSIAADLGIDAKSVDNSAARARRKLAALGTGDDLLPKLERWAAVPGRRGKTLARARHVDGRSVAEVCQHYNVPPITVYRASVRYRDEVCRTPHRLRRTERGEVLARARLVDGQTSAEVAALYHEPITAVYSAVKQHGHKFVQVPDPTTLKQITAT